MNRPYHNDRFFPGRDGEQSLILNEQDFEYLLSHVFPTEPESDDTPRQLPEDK
jgi:hypothetical protein